MRGRTGCTPWNGIDPDCLLLIESRCGGRGKVLSYTKHNIYTGNYELSENGVCSPPDDSEWTVLAYVGDHEEGRRFAEVDGRADSICLTLQDRGFWPVMSFITPTEARLLAHTLLEAVGQE